MFATSYPTKLQKNTLFIVYICILIFTRRLEMRKIANVKFEVIFLSVSQNSRKITCLERSPVPQMVYSHLKQNYSLKRDTRKTFLHVNIYISNSVCRIAYFLSQFPQCFEIFISHTGKRKSQNLLFTNEVYAFEVGFFHRKGRTT